MGHAGPPQDARVAALYRDLTAQPQAEAVPVRYRRAAAAATPPVGAAPSSGLIDQPPLEVRAGLTLPTVERRSTTVQPEERRLDRLVRGLVASKALKLKPPGGDLIPPLPEAAPPSDRVGAVRLVEAAPRRLPGLMVPLHRIVEVEPSAAVERSWVTRPAFGNVNLAPPRAFCSCGRGKLMVRLSGQPSACRSRLFV